MKFYIGEPFSFISVSLASAMSKNMSRHHVSIRFSNFSKKLRINRGQLTSTNEFRFKSWKTGEIQYFCGTFYITLPGACQSCYSARSKQSLLSHFWKGQNSVVLAGKYKICWIHLLQSILRPRPKDPVAYWAHFNSLSARLVSSPNGLHRPHSHHLHLRSLCDEYGISKYVWNTFGMHCGCNVHWEYLWMYSGYFGTRIRLTRRIFFLTFQSPILVL